MKLQNIFKILKEKKKKKLKVTIDTIQAICNGKTIKLTTDFKLVLKILSHHLFKYDFFLFFYLFLWDSREMWGKLHCVCYVSYSFLLYFFTLWTFCTSFQIISFYLPSSLLILSSAMYNLLLDACIEFLILVTQFCSHRLFHISSVYNF